MDKYVKPDVEIIKFATDIVTTSGYPDFNGEETTQGEEKDGWY